MRISRGGPPDDASTRPYATGRRRVQPLVGPRAPSLSDTGGELCERRFLREASGNCTDARRNPIGEWDFFDHVTSRTRVDLAQLRKVIRWKPVRWSWLDLNNTAELLSESVNLSQATILRLWKTYNPFSPVNNEKHAPTKTALLSVLGRLLKSSQ